MNPHEMIAALRAMSAGGDDAPPARPDIRAQRLELLARFRSYHERHEFRPGALVAEKDGHSVFKQDGGGRALIFWRALNPTDPLDAQIIAKGVQRERVIAVDCIVGTIEDGGDGLSSIVFHSHDSARLRPLSAEERAELDAVGGTGGAP